MCSFGDGCDGVCILCVQIGMMGNTVIFRAAFWVWG